ncbi:MAG: amidohydrolase [Bacteroidia bacterium]|nr:amidohydrolase [Bacteroidia bacterium]
MMKYFVIMISTFLMLSCNQQRNKVDVLFINGIVQTANSDMEVVEAFAVSDGKIVAYGSNEQLNMFDAKEVIDLENKYVYPGFYDAHCHFLGYGLDLKKINLTGTQSYEEILELLKQNSNKRTGGWIFGRGWDQNDWEVQEYPTNKEINELFPDVPVYLLRIDGHAAIVNDHLLNLAGLTAESKIEGGELLLKDGRLTGVVIDNVLDSIITLLPEYSVGEKTEALISAQKNCFEVGLTTVADAGIDADDVELIQELQQNEELNMNIYAMISYSEENAEYYRKKGKIQTDNLTVRSFKIYSDGALGSRGACLLKEYSDKKNHKGFLLNLPYKLEEAATVANEIDFQINTHAIGDSAARTMLDIYSKFLPEKNDKRWRIEHSQVVNAKDFKKYKEYKIIPSVQPTHATSDMYWAEERVGAERMKGAYAYQTLLQQNNIIANGSDFPVEDINPLYGFYAAVSRKDLKGYPQKGFQKEEALTREQALKAMTIWAAYSCFEDEYKGSLEQSKFADFVVLDVDLLNCKEEDIPSIKINSTYVKGKKVY